MHCRWEIVVLLRWVEKLCVVSNTLFYVDVPRQYDWGSTTVREGIRRSRIIPELSSYVAHHLRAMWWARYSSGLSGVACWMVYEGTRWSKIISVWSDLARHHPQDIRRF